MTMTMKNPRRRNLTATRRRKRKWIPTTGSDLVATVLLLLVAVVVMLVAMCHHHSGHHHGSHQNGRLCESPSNYVSSLSTSPALPQPPSKRPSSKTRSGTALQSTSKASSSSPPPRSSTNSNVLLNYQYNGFDLTYRKLTVRRRLHNNNSSNSTKDDERNNNNNNDKNLKILLIHPIGVGLASWFWEPFMEILGASSSSSTTTTTTTSNTVSWEVYAPNLIGCGISEGSDAWDPKTRGLFIPLDWARGCEKLMDHVGVDASNQPNQQAQQQQHELLESNNDDKQRSATMTIGDDEDDNDRWTVIVQGGLAPVGVLLAHRNPNRVTSLIMTSPPRWDEMTTPVPENELKRNYDFLTNPFWGNLAFKTLESRRSVKFFSNLFLFSEPCDETWLDNAQREWEAGGQSARPPVQMFNAGFCMNRSFEDELMSLEQPTMVVQGQDDKRERSEYTKSMKDCIVKTCRGQNVLPWEYPNELAQEVVSFLSGI